MSDLTSATESPAAAALETWTHHPWTDGLQVDRLNGLDELSVRTRNNVYRIVVLEPRRGEVLVQGGRFFPELTRARLAGSSLGGAFLKQYGVYVGFRLELHADPGTIVTSTIQSVDVATDRRTH